MRFFAMAACLLLATPALALEYDRGFLVKVDSECGGQDYASEDGVCGKPLSSAVVRRVACNSPAEEAGLEEGDVIKAINGLRLVTLHADAFWDELSDAETVGVIDLIVIRTEGTRALSKHLRFALSPYPPGGCKTKT